MISIKNKSLFRQQAFIDGHWSDADQGNTYGIYNPFDNALIGVVPDMGADETTKAIKAASNAFPKWKSMTAGERSTILKRWYELQMENLEDLAFLLTLEQGKPIHEARGEIRYGASFIEWFAEEGKRAYGDVIPGHGRDKKDSNHQAARWGSGSHYSLEFPKCNDYPQGSACPSCWLYGSHKTS